MPQPLRAIRETTEPGAAAVADFLRAETTGGQFLLAATGIALLWANLDGDSYRTVWDHRVGLGPGWLKLDLSLAHWVSDGLLAVFFFVAGMEVKREFTGGELADRRAFGLPFFAALGGMVVPAIVAIAASGGAAATGGAWATPVATDIAFALGVLALAGSALPSGVRVLLLSMAVVDDLAAIVLIAILFTAGLEPILLLVGCAFAGVYWGALRAGFEHAWLLWLLTLGCWIAIHASGVHATVAGILLGLLTPVRPRGGAEHSIAARFEHRLHPISAGVIVPVFALAAAGIPLAGAGGALTDAMAIGVFAGLLIGKPVGIFAGAYLAVKLKLGRLPDRVRWADMLAVAVLGGIGYTVSLLITQLAFENPDVQRHAATAVLAASALASLVAVGLLRRRTTARRPPPDTPEPMHRADSERPANGAL